MILILGQCNNQVSVAARRYAEIYLHRHPDRNVTRRAEILLHETGTVYRQDAGRELNMRRIHEEEEIILKIEDDP